MQVVSDSLRLSTRQWGYFLINIGLLLVAVAWINSYPLTVESSTSHLFDSIYPSFWLGLSMANLGLFLVASRSRSRAERLACAFAFFVLAYSIRYFSTFLGGVDSDYFRGLTENYAASGVLLPQQHEYYQWPLLFILDVSTARILGLSVQLASEVLFFAWNFLLAAGLFSYSNGGDDVTDFLSATAYGISSYTFLVWQYSAQTFALVLLLWCVSLMLRNGASYRVISTLFYVALVFTHAFFAVFLVVATWIRTLMKPKSFHLAIIFTLVYATYVAFQAAILGQELVNLAYTSLFFEYSLKVARTFGPGPVSPLDALAQTVSRLVSISAWGLLASLSIWCLVLKKLRAMDVSLGVSGAVYAIAGAIVPVLGIRAAQVIAIPTTHAVRVSADRSRARKALLSYFLLALVVFPVGMIHLFYNDTNYMTVREQDAIDRIFVAISESRKETSFEMIARSLVCGYINSRTNTYVYCISEDSPPQYLERANQVRFVFFSPEMEKDFLTAGVSEKRLLTLEARSVMFSRIYSNGHVDVLVNSNASVVP
jgi:hypothetical protein